MNATSKQFFADHPKSTMVYEVGELTFVGSAGGEAREYAARHNAEVIEVARPMPTAKKPAAKRSATKKSGGKSSTAKKAAADKEAAEQAAADEAAAKAAAQGEQNGDGEEDDNTGPAAEGDARLN